MDTDLQELMDGGVGDAVTAWDDVVTVEVDPPHPNLVLHGVQSDTTVEQQVLLASMGFQVQRSFSLLVGNVVVNGQPLLGVLKSGMRAVDAQGEGARFCHYLRDPHGFLLFFELNK